MAKGQVRGNREVKKPKKEKAPATAPAGSTLLQGIKSGEANKAKH
ncbi:hypothetical protein IGB42_00979 [Andreprevotia sp. IGB-42]|nr:hypothetical protein [Andreprevotia sp. IGB-42]KAF0814923.1 hypothetical protein IGB42_00979 [Andreprevotia sp. IGB-42]